MKFWHILCALTLLCLVVLVGCRSGSKSGSTSTNQNNAAAIETSDSVPVPNQSSNENRLILAMPDCTDKAAGEIFSVSLQGDFIEPFYQISARLKFDSTAIQPVSAEKGSWFANSDIEYLNLAQKDILPFALTPKNQTSKARNGNGTLAKFKFRIIDPSKDCRVQLINDLTFLHVRNDKQQRIVVNIEREVTK